MIKTLLRTYKNRFEVPPDENQRATIAGEINYENGKVFYLVFIASVMLLPFIPMDFMMHPYPWLLLWLKAALFAVCMLLAGLRFTKRFRYRPAVLLRVMIITLFLCMAIIMGTSGDYANAFISTGSLVFLAPTFIVLPPLFRWGAIALGLGVLAMLAAVFGIDLSQSATQHAVSAILIISVITLFLSHGNYRTLVRNWEQRQYLNATKDQLQARLEEARRADEMFSTLLATAPFGMEVWNKQGELVSVNERLVALVGAGSEGDMIGNYFNTYTAPFQEGDKPVKEHAHTLLAKTFTEGSTQFEWTFLSADGEEIPTEITWNRFTFKGEVMAAAYINDLRAQRKKDEATREAEQRLSTIINASPIICSIFNDEHKIIDANHAAAQVLDLENEQVYIDHLHDLTPEFQPDGTHSRTKWDEMLRTAFTTGQANFVWMHCSLDKQTLYPCEVFLRRLDLGERKVVVAYIIDMREHNRLMTTLEDTVTREQLANQAKTRFLARMSHEIRTPMNSVLGITEIELQKNTHPPETEEAFNRIYNSSHMLLTIINDILDLSKVEAGKMEIVPGVYETASLIVDTVQLNLMYLGSKQIEFTLHVDENIPKFLIGDELRVKQILTNIISNAFKYTDEGYVRLSFEAENMPGTGEVHLIANVTDTGQGMSDEQVAGLSAECEYSRFNLNKNQNVEGTGLGLSIAFQLIEMMNGSVSIKSELGKGSSFTVRLPQQQRDNTVIGAEVAERLERLEDTQISLARSLKLRREPMPYGRVLIVDDVESNIFVAKGFLMPYKLFIDSVESGIAAIEKIKAGERYDIIFMDHMMPDLDGIAATQIIRGMGYNEPIVALTANAFSEMAQVFMDNGFSGYASKPIDVNQLDKHLMEFIYRKQPVEVINRARRKRFGTLTDHTGTEISDTLAASFIRDACKALDSIEAYMQSGSQDDLKSYIIQVHAMKSALFNVGYKELSSTAAKLERAGRKNDLDKIMTETPPFVSELKAITEEFERKQKSAYDGTDTEANQAIFFEYMQKLADALESYEIDVTNESFRQLHLIDFSKKTRMLIDELFDLTLSGDFEKAGILAKEAAKRR
ncbi:MAG: ATP-binding protein [Defluviitaleaceae bacterium]|nr:ATP-binding protein [Defluviitaleaceae bacterium]